MHRGNIHLTPERLKKYSDLDIAVLSEKPLSMDTMAAIKDAFSESDLCRGEWMSSTGRQPQIPSARLSSRSTSF